MLKQKINFIYISLISILSFQSINATDYYVSNTGNDNNSGTSISSPFLTLAHAVPFLNEGDTLFIRRGTYREGIVTNANQDGTLNNPITITAYNNEEVIIKGSEIVNNWTLFSGDIYKKTGWHTASQQIFIEERILRQLGHVAPPIAGVASDGFWMIEENNVNPNGMSISDMQSPENAKSFLYNSDENTLYLRYNGLNPNNYTVEVSTNEKVVYIRDSDHVHIRGIKFRHSNTSVRKASAGIIELGNFSIIENCDIQWGDQSGVEMGYQREGSQVINSTLNNNGSVGISAALSNDFIIKGCIVKYNNYRRFNTLWHAGGVKIVADAWGNVIGNEIAFNTGTGLWFDYCNGGNPSKIIGNNIHDNGPKHAGLFLEASRNITVYNNIINHNSRLGISIEASDHLNIFNNEIMNTYGDQGIGGVAGLRVVRDPFNYPSVTLSNIYIYNNVFYNNKEHCIYDIHILPENPAHGIEKIFVDYNLYYNSNNQYRFLADGVTSSSFSNWQAQGKDIHGVIGNPLYTAPDEVKKNSNSPAIDTGINIGYIDTDYHGTDRPLGMGTDIGASEFNTTMTSNLPPTANAGSDFVVDEGANFNLSATLSTDDGTITNYLWKDGNIELYNGSNATSPSLTFDNHGTYTVSLTVTDDSGTISTDSVIITVKIPEGKLLLHWNFDDGDGIVSDLSSYGNDGTLNSSASYISPGYNNADHAVSLNGVTGTVTCTNTSVTSPHKLTIMSWMYQKPNPPKWYGGISKANSWNIRATKGSSGFVKWKFELIDINYIHHVLVSTSEVSFDSWHHIAGSYDGNTMKLYVDGVLDIESSPSSFIIKNGWQIYAGNSLGRFFFGKIDEVKWYNDALSDSDIQSEYIANNLNIGFHIYPNPTNKILHINTNDTIITKVEIINTLGHVITVKNIAISNQMDIDLESNTAGVYFVKIITKKGIYLTKVILKK